MGAIKTPSLVVLLKNQIYIAFTNCGPAPIFNTRLFEWTIKIEKKYLIVINTTFYSFGCKNNDSAIPSFCTLKMYIHVLYM